MPQFFKYDKPYLINRKFKMPAIFILKKKTAKKKQIFHIFESFLFCNGWPY